MTGSPPSPTNARRTLDDLQPSTFVVGVTTALAGWDESEAELAELKAEDGAK